MSTRDLVIVGAGPAGLWCAAEARARGLETTIVEALSFGGQLVNIAEIDDGAAVGIASTTAGWDLAADLVDAAQDAGAEILMDTIELVEEVGGAWRVSGRDVALDAGAIVIATGTHEQPLGVPGSDALAGRGVSSCAACDGPLFAGRVVVVIGGNTIAMHEARFLSSIAESVTVLVPDAAPHAPRDRVEAVEGLANVRIIVGATLLEIVGDTAVEGMRYTDATGEHAAEINAVFNALDRVPSAFPTKPAVAVDADGAVIVTLDLAASEHGLFAAGDTRSGSGRDIATARLDGERAAGAVVEHLEGRRR